MTDFHDYKGYWIPVDLIDKTGGGADTWDGIAENHMRVYAQYCPIEPDHVVLEVGCAVGRDAIPLTERLSDKGRYIGIDIMQDCISWCRDNVTKRHPNFTFFSYDVRSQDYNPGGSLKTSDVILPVAESSLDRILLQSVFTHMLDDDITHYLREFRRTLKPDALVFASCFFLDEETRELAAENARYKFEYSRGDGFFVIDPRNPAHVVGFDDIALKRMLGTASMDLAQPVHRGYWCGRRDNIHFQDILILRRS